MYTGGSSEALKKGETDSPTRSANMHSWPAEDIGVCIFAGTTAKSTYTIKRVREGTAKGVPGGL